MKNDEMKEMQFSNLLSFVHAKNKIKWRGGEGNETRGGAKLRLEGKMKRRYLKKKSERLRGREIVTTNEIPSEM